MELSPFAIYLIFTADSIKPLLGIFGTIGVIFGGVAFWSGTVEEIASAAKFGKFAIPLGVLAITAATIIPSTKTLIAMYGIPAAIEGAKNVATSEVGQKAYGAVNKLLDDYLKSK